METPLQVELISPPPPSHQTSLEFHGMRLPPVSTGCGDAARVGGWWGVELQGNLGACTEVHSNPGSVSPILDLFPQSWVCLPNPGSLFPALDLFSQSYLTQPNLSRFPAFSAEAENFELGS